jgi:hypothetical protein
MSLLVTMDRFAAAARRKSSGVVALMSAIALFSSVPTVGAEAAKPKAWTDKDLVASYADLSKSGLLHEAIRTPSLPSDPPSPAFLEALAWFAAGAPAKAGSLTSAALDAFIDDQAELYQEMLRAKVEKGVDNDYPRTRTWKVVQKMTMLRNEMAQPAHAGVYAFGAMPRSAAAGDAWEQAHTLSSPAEFTTKVCAASYQRPVLVKFGNTNCTQCMLFEMMGSIQELAKAPAFAGTVDVYKVWFGLHPDASFAGRIRDPARLDELATAEEVRSSPTFVVYRNARRYTCGDGFPATDGSEHKLEACVRQNFGEAPEASACKSAAS